MVMFRRDSAKTKSRIVSIKLENPAPKDKSWSLNSWLKKSVSSGKQTSKSSHEKEISALIKEPKQEEASTSDFAKTTTAHFKIERLNSIESGEIERIYREKNYDDLQLDEMKAAKIFTRPSRESGGMR
ncbi:hypothetical protein QAD02_005710 [Eretmocerus hayati]|uniref:Uncharacterized protein n=1 Tax=Eretmocerus hayati TaxID=131215 RepID=A0ACC2NUC5_9HYME|nr:hypothetical protein QAD02_005710 [Eretmocerus hayati]